MLVPWQKNRSEEPVTVDDEEMMVVECEESKVGETQPTQDGRDDECWNGSQSKNPIGLVVEYVEQTSPTKTITLEDDRRAEQIIQEWNDICYQLPSDNAGSGPGLDNSDPTDEIGSSSLSAPQGFERIRTRKTSLKLIEQVNEKARKRKEALKKKRATKQRAREDEAEAVYKDWASEEEIENSDPDAEKTWWVGTKAGLGTDSVNRAKKYLKTTTAEVEEKERVQNKRRTRGRKGKIKEVEQVAKGKRWLCLFGNLKELAQQVLFVLVGTRVQDLDGGNGGGGNTTHRKEVYMEKW
ncbi:hypothetical protein PIB30_030052 [Stylosanthes scabra]|uniref:Uncharacterized protein n=1 Tax=Stylosanthes scabra TaxID=79078 RepID=A0ABU6UAU4_9FABA|nr:hypothetical protein [Stylosanthes scabra]